MCPRLNDALKVFYDSAEAKDRVERSRFERAFMGFVTGRPDDFSTENPEDMEHLYSGLYVGFDIEVMWFSDFTDFRTA